MITYKRGDLLSSSADILVNTVNCVGVMGKGIALQFKRKFPAMFEHYRLACLNKNYKPGVCRMWYGKGRPLIINFPTKNDWRNPSQMDWIRAGLFQIRGYLEKNPSLSIAIPPVGCGNGGLKWNEVKPLIEQMFQGLPNLIEVYEPNN